MHWVDFQSFSQIGRISRDIGQSGWLLHEDRDSLFSHDTGPASQAEHELRLPWEAELPLHFNEFLSILFSSSISDFASFLQEEARLAATRLTPLLLLAPAWPFQMRWCFLRQTSSLRPRASRRWRQASRGHQSLLRCFCLSPCRHLRGLRSQSELSSLCRAPEVRGHWGPVSRTVREYRNRQVAVTASFSTEGVTDILNVMLQLGPGHFSQMEVNENIFRCPSSSICSLTTATT